MDGTIDKLLAESADMDEEEIPSDFLEVQEFDEAMAEVKPNYMIIVTHPKPSPNALSICQSRR